MNRQGAEDAKLKTRRAGIFRGFSLPSLLLTLASSASWRFKLLSGRL